MYINISILEFPLMQKCIKCTIYTVQIRMNQRRHPDTIAYSGSFYSTHWTPPLLSQTSHICPGLKGNTFNAYMREWYDCWGACTAGMVTRRWSFKVRHRLLFIHVSFHPRAFTTMPLFAPTLSRCCRHNENTSLKAEEGAIWFSKYPHRKRQKTERGTFD